jgi:diadenosine tetraphosphate (Ap4A) HIT family hydrolase
MSSCLACELSEGSRPLPGGLVHQTVYWRVEHCVGALGLGTFVVKPKRHVTAVAELSAAEAEELGPLLRLASSVAADLVEADQVYNCLWSHAEGVPVHIHYVVQPVTKEQMEAFGAHGPRLQVAMFANGQSPDPLQVDSIAELARNRFASLL